MSQSQISSQLEGNIVFGSNQTSMSAGLQPQTLPQFNSQATNFLARCSSVSKLSGSPLMNKAVQPSLNGSQGKKNVVQLNDVFRGRPAAESKKSSQSASQKDHLIIPQCLIPSNSLVQDQGSHCSNSPSCTLDNFLIKSKQPSATPFIVEKEWLQSKLSNIESQVLLFEKRSNQAQEEISSNLKTLLDKVQEPDIWHQEMSASNDERHWEVTSKKLFQTMEAQAQVIKTLSSSIQDITSMISTLVRKSEEEEELVKNKITKQKKTCRKSSQFERAMQNIIQDKAVLLFLMFASHATRVQVDNSNNNSCLVSSEAAYDGGILTPSMCSSSSSHSSTTSTTSSATMRHDNNTITHEGSSMIRREGENLISHSSLKSMCMQYIIQNVHHFSKVPRGVVQIGEGLEKTYFYNEYLEKLECKFANPLTASSPTTTTSSPNSSMKNFKIPRQRSNSLSANSSSNSNKPSPVEFFINNHAFYSALNASNNRNDDDNDEIYPIPQLTSQSIINDLCNSKQLTLPFLIKMRYTGFNCLNLSLNGRVKDEWMMLLRELPLDTLNLSHCLLTNQSLYFCKGKKHIIPCPSHSLENSSHNYEEQVLDEMDSTQSDCEEQSPTNEDDDADINDDDDSTPPPIVVATEKKTVTFVFDQQNPNRKPKKKKKKQVASSSKPGNDSKKSSSNESNHGKDEKKSYGTKSVSGSTSSGGSTKKRKDGSIQVITPYPLSRTLTSLNMSNIHEISTDAFKLIPQLFPNLTALSFEGCSNFTNKCLEQLCGKISKSDNFPESSKTKQLRRNLKKLNLKRTKISDAGVRNIQSLVNLEYLNLGENKQLTNHSFKFFKALKKLSHLELCGNERMTDEGIGKYLGRGNLIDLKTLSISGTYMGDDVKNFYHFPNLTCWNAANTNIQTIENNYCNSFVFNNLTKLNLSYCKLLDDHSTKHFLESLHHLVDVNLSNTFLEDDAISGLLSSRKTLQILHINSCTHITDWILQHVLPAFDNICELGLRHLKQVSFTNGWIYLFKSNLPKLDKLYLSASFINQRLDGGERDLFSELFANFCQTLTVLDLSCNMKGLDDQLLGLALSKMTSLSWLDLSHCESLTSVTIQTISKYLRHHLKHLAISYCHKIDGSSLPLLQNCKRIEVLYISGIHNFKTKHLRSLCALEYLSDLSLMDCKKLQRDDGCSECLKILSEAKFARRLVMLNLYGLLIWESALDYLVSFDSLITLRMSTHVEMENMDALYCIPNLVYLKTKSLDW
ncbi:hypothetical protein C9374_013389 [Naegleria lovaniensis]|uniref:Protein AMN1 homolog n=1 Tax=Naegleria lovaniensis TaxID=51637 RepID=A0AA88GWN0_NAELO|nr:uncharacterized protein C9374_013389 [Naegleria lovaniensis]KAG2391904.1 hypothetical protein C9374_013389 [Naegleria lovaniensis]